MAFPLGSIFKKLGNATKALGHSIAVNAQHASSAINKGVKALPAAGTFLGTLEQSINEFVNNKNSAQGIVQSVGDASQAVQQTRTYVLFAAIGVGLIALVIWFKSR